MTNKEAIKWLETAKIGVEWEYPLEICVAIDMAIEALEAVGKADKYKWHDLRKNPEDLPDTPRLVLTKIDFEYWEYEISRYMQFECTGMWMNQKAQPIAWREIEPFEEEE